jgi:hypothetical protein
MKLIQHNSQIFHLISHRKCENVASGCERENFPQSPNRINDADYEHCPLHFHFNIVLVAAMPHSQSNFLHVDDKYYERQ